MPKLKIEYVHKVIQAYTEKCKVLCRELSLPQTAFDILMFLGNNPQYSTARDISEIRGIKSNLVSVNVEKLVQAGYLERKSIDGDRRKIALLITEKARPIIAEGQAMQADFENQLLYDIDENEMNIFLNTIEKIKNNVDNMIKAGD